MFNVCTIKHRGATKVNWTHIFSPRTLCERLNVSSETHNRSNNHEVPSSFLPPSAGLHVPESCTRFVRQLLPWLCHRHETKSKEKHRELQDAGNRWRLQHQSCGVFDEEKEQSSNPADRLRQPK